MTTYLISGRLRYIPFPLLAAAGLILVTYRFLCSVPRRLYQEPKHPSSLSAMRSMSSDIMSSMPRLADRILHHLNLSSTPRTCSTFPLFNYLPSELRAKIWQPALPGPRVIEIRNRTDRFANLRGTPRVFQVNSICRIPNLLHICPESRAEALKHYELSFSAPYCPPKIWVDFSRDIVYFGTKSDFFVAQGPPTPFSPPTPIPIITGLDKIRYLALRSHDWIPKYYLLNVLKLERFRSLEKVFCVKFCVKQHDLSLELGPEPVLREEDFTPLVGPGEPTHTHLNHLMRTFNSHKKNEPDWKIPIVRRACWVPGKLDRWGSSWR